jgi:hypothetical protein
MSLLDPFTRHPASVGESYAQHMRHAGGFALAMLAGGMACLVHALLPFACTKTASRTITRLHDRMVVNRSKAAPGS